MVQNPPSYRRWYGSDEVRTVRQSRPIGQILFCIILIVTGFSAHAAAAIHNVKTNCGATGNGTTDDTAAINTCIGALVGGDTLLFPAGTYYVSSTLTISVSNVIVDGSNGAASLKCSGGRYCMTIGGGNKTASTPLTADSAALSTSFQANLSAIGIVDGSYVELEEGGVDVARNITDPLSCSAATPCRSEVLHVTSVSGNTATIDTAAQTTPGVHFPYDYATPASLGCASPFTACPSANGAHVYRLVSPVSGITVQNIILDGSGSTGEGAFLVQDVVNSTLSGVTIRHFAEEGIQIYYTYNLALNTILIQDAGTNGGQGAFNAKNEGHTMINGMTFNSMRHDSWPFFMGGGADNTVADVEVDGGSIVDTRLFNLGAISYSTFNSINVHDAASGNIDNGVSMQYYAQHLTFNSCRVVNTGTSGGLIGFGNDNSFNTFNDCTATGSKGWQIANAGLNDTNWTISGGTYANSIGGNDIIHLSGNSGHYVHDTSVSGPGNIGINLNTAKGSCSNNNTFVGGSGLSGGILTSSTTVVGSGNVLNNFSSNLTPGTCGDGGTPAAPTGLSATVH